MREIKFRAWDIIDKEMRYRAYVWASGALFWDDGKSFSLIRDRQDTILMQYTGLKDKNGKEIYEGDFLGDVGEKVIFCERCLGFQVAYCTKDDEYLCHNCDGDYSLAECIEDGVVNDSLGLVVGNVYEKSDL